ncbi:unnamed protein product, partial [Musa hybrid cultivar]
LVGLLHARLGSGQDPIHLLWDLSSSSHRGSRRSGWSDFKLSSPSSRWRRSFGTIITSGIGDLIWTKGFIVMGSCSIWVIVLNSTRNRTRRRGRLLR